MEKVCVIDGCRDKNLARGWCTKHYQRWYKRGDPLKTLTNMDHGETCAVKGCDKAFYVRNMCRQHYDRYKRNRVNLEAPFRPRRKAATSQCSPAMAEIYWAAGIFEGEGHVDWYHSQSTRLVVTQKDTWVLHKLQYLFGGLVYGRPDRYISRWSITGPRAQGFVMTIYSLLSPRRQSQVIRALPWLHKELKTA